MPLRWKIFGDALNMPEVSVLGRALLEHDLVLNHLNRRS